MSSSASSADRPQARNPVVALSTSPPPKSAVAPATNSTASAHAIQAHAALSSAYGGDGGSSSSMVASCSSSSSAAAAAAAAVAGGNTSTAPAAQLHPTLPSAETQRQVAEARAAVVASMGNMLDAELQGRAQMLHEGAAALDRQERDVARATEALRRERQKLAREADAAARRLKEVGNVQNWAEVLERGFLVLEETVRLANSNGGGGRGGGRGGAYDDEDDNDDGDGASGSCSCSECGRGSLDDEDGMDLDSNVDRDGDGGLETFENGHVGVDMGVPRDSWSDASRSLLEPDPSTSSGQAKGSETASLSTASIREPDPKQPGGS